MNEKHKNDEENWGQWRAAGFALHTIRGRVDAVIHKHVPVLACRDHKEGQEGLAEILEVPVWTDHLTVSQTGEEENCKDRENKKYQKQQQEDIGQRTNWESNGGHQGLESLVLARKFDHSSNSQHSENSGDLGAHTQCFIALSWGPTDYDVNQRRHHNKEIKFVPGRFKVPPAVSLHFKYHFNCENHCEEVVWQVEHLSVDDWLIFECNTHLHDVQNNDCHNA